MLRIGALEIHRVVEMEEPFVTAQQLFCNVEPEALEAAVRQVPEHLICAESKKLMFSFHGFVVKTPQHTILIDTCVGCDKSNKWKAEWYKRSDRVWLERLRLAGFNPHDIDFVFCTHLHLDHCGWNTQLDNGRWVPTFPNAKYLFATQEYELAQRLDDSVFHENVLPVMEAGQGVLVDMDHGIDDHVAVTPLPGHTAGHCGVQFSSQGERAIMCGDAIHHPMQCQHPDWLVTFDDDLEHAQRTRIQFLQDQSENGQLVLTAHFPSPSAGFVKPAGEAFSFSSLD